MNTERKKKKTKNAIWPDWGMRKVAMMATRMARLPVRIKTRVPRSQHRDGKFNFKSAEKFFFFNLAKNVFFFKKQCFKNVFRKSALL